MLTDEDKADIDAYITHRILLLLKGMQEDCQIPPIDPAKRGTGPKTFTKLLDWNWGLQTKPIEISK